MNKTSFLIFALISIMMLSSTSVSVFTVHKQTVRFTGKAAISIVEGIISWRITVDGTIKIPGEPSYVGKYTMVKLLNGDIIGPIEADDFQWSWDECHLRVALIDLTVHWFAEPPTETLHLNLQRNEDIFVFNGPGRTADLIAYWGQQTNEGNGFVLCGSGKIVLQSPKTPTYSIAWDSDVQITTTGAPSIYPTLGAKKGTIHLAWVDGRDGDGNREIYYKRSTDYGTTWTAVDTRISNNQDLSIRASFAVRNNAVHLFWRDNRDGDFEEYFRQSFDNGVSWGSETRITSDSGYSGCPFPAVHKKTLHLFWRDNRLGTFKIYYKRSTDSGKNWGTDILLTPNAINGEFPYPAIIGDTLHLVWRDTRDGNAEIYYKRSIDGGISWTEDMRLTNNLGESEHPKLVVKGNSLHVVWRDDRDGNYEVYYKRSADGGLSWSEDERLTNNVGKSLWPVIAVGDDLLHLLWCDDQDETQALYYRFSSDGGDTWSAETKLSECVALADLLSANPIIVTGKYIHVVFNDDRTGENEIYYKRGTISLP